MVSSSLGISARLIAIRPSGNKMHDDHEVTDVEQPFLMTRPPFAVAAWPAWPWRRGPPQRRARTPVRAPNRSAGTGGAAGDQQAYRSPRRSATIRGRPAA